jgi:hypothetical protein
VVISGGGVRLARERIGDRGELATLGPQQVAGINPRPVEQGKLYQQF